MSILIAARSGDAALYAAALRAIRSRYEGGEEDFVPNTHCGDCVCVKYDGHGWYYTFHLLSFAQTESTEPVFDLTDEASITAFLERLYAL